MAGILPSDLDPGAFIAMRHSQVGQRGDQLAIIRICDVIAHLICELQERCCIHRRTATKALEHKLTWKKTDTGKSGRKTQECTAQLMKKKRKKDQIYESQCQLILYSFTPCRQLLLIVKMMAGKVCACVCVCWGGGVRELKVYMVFQFN